MQCRRTRIAPTPSGYLHLGNILSFAITASLAEQTGARTLLRIDDLDHERAREMYVQDIFDTLEFLHIPWHEGPRNAEEFRLKYSQQHRRKLYSGVLKKLEEQQEVFACRCTRTQLAEAGDTGYPGTCLTKHYDLHTAGVNWRLNTSEARAISVMTASNASVNLSLPAAMRHFVVRKKDGNPSYQLASLVDDMFFEVDLVVRGTDLLPSTLAQLFLARQLEFSQFTNTIFHHHQLLKTATGDKLSKSAGDTSVRYLRNAGATAADIFAAISQLCGMSTIATDWRALGTYFLRSGGL